MRCNKGQALWEVTFFLAVVAIIAGGVIWWLLKKPSEANTFKDKAKQYQYSETYSGIRLFDFSCVPRSTQEGWLNANINKTAH